MIRLEGIYTALITPFKTIGKEVAAEPDYEAIRKLVDWQIKSGIAGIVALGTTGEAATLNEDEKISVVKCVLDAVKGRVPVIVGTGSNCTSKSIEFTKLVKELGVDASLAVAPYYNKPSQEGMFQHFSELAKKGGLPVCLYNVPGRTSVDLKAETVARLAKVPGIIGIKDATGSAERVLELSYIDVPTFSLLTGDDHMICCNLAHGGKGAISASANVIPAELVAIYEAGKRKDFDACLAAQQKAYPVIKALFMETNPTPAKTALQLLGRISSDEVRLPLVPSSCETRDTLKQLIA